MGNGIKLFVVFGALALTGCNTLIETRQISDNEYKIIAVPPGGMFAGFSGGPSTTGLPKKAVEICPSGYDKLEEGQEVFEGVSVYWNIRCHAVTP